MGNPNSILVQCAHGPSTPSPLSSLSTVELLADQSTHPSYWVIEAQGLEKWFDNSAGGLTVPNAQEIAGFPVRSALIVRLTWTNHTGRSLYFDLGTTLRACVFARSIQLSICGPSGVAGLRATTPGAPMVQGSQVSVTSVEGQAYVLDSCICPVGSSAPRRVPAGSLGLRQGRLTLRQLALKGVAPTVEVPVGVTDLQIFSRPIGPPDGMPPIGSAPWIWVDRDGDHIGQVTLAAGGMSDRVMVPGIARALALSSPPQTDTFYTFAFGLEW